MFRRAFTMLELIFVIVIMGIMAKFGVELILQTYTNHTRVVVHNELESKVEAAILTIAKRLERRVKDSVVTSVNGAAAGFSALSSTVNVADRTFEWITVDVDGFNAGNWSGMADIWHPNTNNTQLATPSTNTINGGAILFVGSDVDPLTSFGWSGAANANAIFPVGLIAAVPTVSPAFLITPTGFGTVYEFYQVVDGAVGVRLINRNLMMGIGYRPWIGDVLDADRLLLEDVTTFTMQKAGDIIKIQICVENNNFLGEGRYSVCKEKVVF